MKFRIISTILLLVVLGVCYFIFESNIPPTIPPSSGGITLNQ